MITAGTDTTVITVEWAIGELVRNPRVQEKVKPLFLPSCYFPPNSLNPLYLLLSLLVPSSSF
jgi:hypothetical protein